MVEKRFRVLFKDGETCGRIGLLSVMGKAVETPIFMPVGTLASVKGLGSDDLEGLGVKAILVNTFHLYLRPGPDVVEAMGGLHRFMGYDGIIISDSGGFQVYSLRELRRLKEDGVEFRSPIDGSRHFFTPESVIEIQKKLGSDFIVLLDECTSYPATPAQAKSSVDLTLRWAGRGAEAAKRMGVFDRVFPVIQGSTFKDLRIQCAEALKRFGFPQYAIGGLSVGEPKDALYSVCSWIRDVIPEDSPLYLMGVGKPEDIIQCVMRGIDMFDCVIPTRNARNGLLYTWKGRVVIKNSACKTQDIPIDPDCTCPTCRRYPRSYLHHLYHAKELSFYRLSTIHNIHFYMELVEAIKTAIKSGELKKFAKEMEGKWESSA